MSDPAVILEALFDSLPVRPAWHRLAECRGMDPAIFFPGRGAPFGEAKQVCARCPVAGDCREWAIDRTEKHGIWGGTTENDRRRLRRVRRQAS